MSIIGEASTSHTVVEIAPDGCTTVTQETETTYNTVSEALADLEQWLLSDDELAAANPEEEGHWHTLAVDARLCILHAYDDSRANSGSR